MLKTLFGKYWALVSGLAGAGFVAAQSAGADGWDWRPDGIRTGVVVAGALVAWIIANGPAGSGWRYAKVGGYLVVAVGGELLVVWADGVLSAPDLWALGMAIAVTLGLIPTPPTATSLAAPRTADGTRAHLIRHG